MPWTSGGGTVRILDVRSGEELVRVGDRIRIGGGQLMYEHLSERVRARLPADCPGPYWAVGLGVERWDPTPTALPTPSPQPGRTPTIQPTVAAERAFAPLTPVPTPPGAPGADLALLYIHDGDLWRADMSGAHRQRLITGQPLQSRDQRRGEGCDGDRFSWGCPAHVFPDGRWIAQWTGGPGMLLVDVTEGAQGWLPSPVGPEAAWSPDGRTLAWSPDPDVPGSPAGVVEVYAYDTDRGWGERLFQGDRETWVGLSHLVWSPDGRQIAFGCCYEEVFVDGTNQGRALGEVHVPDVAGRDVRDTGQPIEAYVARSTTLCWTVAGGVTTTREEGIACSPVREPWEAWRSPDGAYLLLDDANPDTPIWRLPADGAGELEVVIEAGLLVDVVPQWAE